MGEQARQWIEEQFSSAAMVERSCRMLQAVASGTFPRRSEREIRR
jgi:hypothetical protein